MIVLDAIDAMGTRVRLAEPEDAVASAAADVKAVQDMLEILGLDDVELRSDEPRQNELESMVDHHWEIRDGKVEYRVAFPHAVRYGSLISRYTTVALSTFGTRDERGLSELRLSIYEICMNCLAHGTPTGEDAKLKIALRFEADGIVGWIEDECEPFDLTQANPPDVHERARLRAPRGYGIPLIRRILSELSYERVATGNRVHFMKRMKR